MGDRQCVNCGKIIADTFDQCPFCREPLPTLPVLHTAAAPAGQQIRRGLLWMLLAAVLYYFAAGYSAYQIPLPFARWLTAWVLPLLFLSGFGMVFLGVYRRITS
jgi:hypothetical protein